MRSDLIWDDAEPEIDDLSLIQVEKFFDVIFPGDYKDCVKKHHGGTPDKDCFNFTDEKLGEMSSGIGVLFSINTGKMSDIIYRYEMLKDQLPNNIIPISDDGGGDLVSFNYSVLNKDGEPTIVYWHHERNIDESITQLANSFSDFLDMLYE